MGDILSRVELPDTEPAVLPGRGGGRWRAGRGALLMLGAILAVWAWVTVPWLSGDRRLVLRDVLYTHTQFKYFGAQQLAEGRIPAINPTWGIGQPYRGNPNTLAYYPGNLLYLVLPFQVAFHAHYALHWLLAFLGMWRLARRLGQSAEAALLSGLTWGASGYLLSLLTFYNLLTVAAWAPVAMLGLAMGSRRGTALGGFALGMMVLGGEPMTAALLGPAILAVACGVHGARRGVLGALAAGGLGLAVALPQIVATLRVLPFSFRAAHGLEASEAAAQSLGPLRLLELILPLPWGWPSDFAYFGFWSDVATPEVPYIYSLYIGIVGLALAVVAIRRQRAWTLLAVGALLFAGLAGLYPRLLLALTFGVFRYPQKALVLFTLAAALLAGWGLDAALGRRRLATGIVATGTVLLLVGGAMWLGRSTLVEALRTGLAEGQKAPAAATQAILWTVGTAIAGLLLVATGLALARRRPAVVVGLQLLALLQLAPTVVTAEAAVFRDPPPAFDYLDEPTTLVPVPHVVPDWERRLPYPLAALTPEGQAQVSWFQLEPAFGVPLGLRYPLAPDVDGLMTPLHVLVERNLQLGDWPARLPWLARLGVGWVLRFDHDPVPGLERVARLEQFRVPVELLRVPNPAPPLRWPDQLVAAESPIAAFVAASRGQISPAAALVSRQVPHQPGGRLALIEQQPDRWVFDVESDGGLAVVQTAWHPIWSAHLEDGTPLRTQPADLSLTGVELPAGSHRVTLEVAALPEQLAGLAALLTLATMSWMAWTGRAPERTT